MLKQLSFRHKELEQLWRYVARSAIANERRKRNRRTYGVLQLKKSYKNDTLIEVIT